MLILGIESSCDETSIAVVENGRLVRSCIISSSKKDFETLGGVIPEEAARRQQEVILPVLEKALSEAQTTMKEIEAIAVTSGPGLLGSLLVGTMTAKALGLAFEKPIIPVHHTMGHLSSTWLTATASTPEPAFPLLTLSVSGGHTDLWLRTSHTKGELIGRTKDDAAGEAFDKGAVQLGLPYPGGPALSKIAESGNPERFEFPRPLHGDASIAFSFSGLKTSLKYLLKELGAKAEDSGARSDIAASYEHAICRHLLDKLSQALSKHDEVREVHIVGGVSANTRLRDLATKLAEKHGVTLRVPETLRYCTDNGAMIASAGEFLVREQPHMLGAHLETRATIPLEQVLSRN